MMRYFFIHLFSEVTITDTENSDQPLPLISVVINDNSPLTLFSGNQNTPIEDWEPFNVPSIDEKSEAICLYTQTDSIHY